LKDKKQKLYLFKLSKAGMKVTVLHGSPRKEKSNTSILLKPFVDGMKSAGAEVHVFYLKKLEINPCRGCFYCWLKHPGECYHRDDVREIISSLKESEIWVLATPVYVDGMTGIMKNLLDRLIPMVEPFFEMRENHFRHIVREDVRGGKVVLLSNCGFYELDNFDPLVEHVKAFCKNINREFTASLLRPHGEALKPLMSFYPDLVNGVLDSLREAGKLLIETGNIPKELVEEISKPLMPPDVYFETANRMFKEGIEYWKTKLTSKDE
jgi:multimeric flavodoxin WrbA